MVAPSLYKNATEPCTSSGGRAALTPVFKHREAGLLARAQLQQLQARELAGYESYRAICNYSEAAHDGRNWADARTSLAEIALASAERSSY